MTIGTVTGHIHSTIDHPFYTAKRLLLVERKTPRASGPAATSSPWTPWTPAWATASSSTKRAAARARWSGRQTPRSDP